MTPPAAIEPVRPETRNRSLAIGGTFVLLAFVAGVVAFIPHIRFIALSACYLGAFFAYIGLRTGSQRGHLFEVIVPFSVISFLYFCVGTLYLVFVPKALAQQELAAFLLPALSIATLGFLCFLVGYGSFFQSAPPSRLGRYVPSSPMVYLVPAGLGTLGIGVHQFQQFGILHDRGISSSLSLLQQFAPLFLFAWFLTWYMVFAKRLRRSVAVPLIGLMSLMSGLVLMFTIGSKSMAITLLGMPTVAYYEVKRRLPWKTIAVVGMLFVFLIFPVYNTFRRTDRNLDTSRRVDRTFDQARSWNSEEYLEESVYAFLKRIGVITSVAAIVSDTGRWVSYRYGETLVLAPISVFIPRFLWPDKPNISIGKEFGETFRLTNTMDRETEIAITMVGDFYWNFALPGVVVGMCLLGMGYRWFYQRYGAGAGFAPVRKAVYFTLLPTALVFEGNVAFVLSGLIKVLVILVIFLVLSRRLGWLEEIPAA